MIRYFVCVLIGCCLAAVIGPTAAVAQQESSAKASPAETKKKKKPQKPFRWVNPLPEHQIAGLEHATFDSRLADQAVGYAILLPPGYETSQQRYPVIYYLHGGRPGSEAKGVGVAREIVRLRGEHEVAPVIYVFVNGGPVSHYNVPASIGVPGQPDAVGADVFIRELIPHIDATYRTIADRKGRGLEGFSQGGRGTMRLSLRYPEIFSSVAAGGGGYATEKRISESPDSAESETLRFAKGDNTWDLARTYAARKDAPKLHLMLYVGTDGFNYENNLQYMQFLKELGIEHKPLVVPDVPHSATKIYGKKGLEIMRFHEASFARQRR
ncbi:1,4-beta-xylanase [Roseiconus nitratireducens]|uniref:1,4-beta-xylanase n=1 Tax=Roseiconus nitratireducens TaxID=2605748 RepID=A0A5M6DAD8_9BACT|nr:alpha/beta hydrolase-fold protein [Roseiconus nitratireducens]KAA5544517.1 1,4-beta-xylanase [Roseiconus nitratireducens]